MSMHLELADAADVRLIATALYLAGGADLPRPSLQDRDRCRRLAFEISAALLELDRLREAKSRIRRRHAWRTAPTRHHRQERSLTSSGESA